MDGVIVVDKPSAWTSHDVVGKMRRIAGTRRVGHLGTLDPLATGVLPLILNRATRLSQFLIKSEKVYEAEVTFGFATNTYDSQGYATTEPVGVRLDRDALDRAMAPFLGELMQTPPPVSAKKIDGVPAYKLERKNKPVELESHRAPFIVSMSPPDYPSAWLRPPSAASVSPGKIIVAPPRPARPTSGCAVMQELIACGPDNLNSLPAMSLSAGDQRGPYEVLFPPRRWAWTRSPSWTRFEI